MAGEYAPKKGDHVRVVIEGVVEREVSDFGILVNNTDGKWLAELYTDRPGVTVEKVESPVEVFKPGDVVQSRATGYRYARYAIARGGYTDLLNGIWRAEPGTTFTSRYYEKVDLG
jgi:hypothetical protein